MRVIIYITHIQHVFDSKVMGLCSLICVLQYGYYSHLYIFQHTVEWLCRSSISYKTQDSKHFPCYLQVKCIILHVKIIIFQVKTERYGIKRLWVVLHKCQAISRPTMKEKLQNVNGIQVSIQPWKPSSSSELASLCNAIFCLEHVEWFMSCAAHVITESSYTRQSPCVTIDVRHQSWLSTPNNVAFAFRLVSRLDIIE